MGPTDICHVSDAVVKVFEERMQKVLALIAEYNIEFEEIGIFGSYARGDYKITSDIDFCIITPNRPGRRVSGSLREDAELEGGDIIYVTRGYFNNDHSVFAKNLRKDYRRLL